MNNIENKLEAFVKTSANGYLGKAILSHLNPKAINSFNAYHHDTDIIVTIDYPNQRLKLQIELDNAEFNERAQQFVPTYYLTVTKYNHNGQQLSRPQSYNCDQIEPTLTQLLKG